MDYDQLKLSGQLCFPLYALSKEIIRRYKPILLEYNLTYTQYITMLVLWENNNSNVKEIGERLYLDSGTLTPVLKQLDQKGFIVRKRDVNDERNLIISLTRKGEELKDKIKDAPYKMIESTNIDLEDAKELYRMINKVLIQVNSEEE